MDMRRAVFVSGQDGDYQAIVEADFHKNLTVGLTGMIHGSPKKRHVLRNLLLSKRQQPFGLSGSAGWKPCRVRIGSLSKRQAVKITDC